MTGHSLYNTELSFDAALPLYFGAGMETSATDYEIKLKKGPARYEAGSNNLLGAIALMRLTTGH
ncbi:hypothetical protein [Clostridium sp. E02]|uniref:hypothetical protein n=1 Tax=Clostridium sp. E02 TaxID=2487134 RepID=UPI000F543BA3|nr:hypothetical protein [Clostridium sp. E02]